MQSKIRNNEATRALQKGHKREQIYLMKLFALRALFAATILSVAASGCQSKIANTTAANAAATQPRPTATPKPRVMPAALKGQMMPGVWVLCYHRIDEKPKQYTVLQPAEFKAQMEYLKKHNFNVVPLQTIVDAVQYGTKLPPHTVALTFDDGYKDNYTVAYPILKQYKFPATLFIYPYYVSNGGAAIKWEMLKTMVADPLIKIQSHTFTHPNLNKTTRQGNAAIKHEIVDSKNILEQKLGIKIDTLAYPYGVYNPKILAATKAAGYRSAFSIGTVPIDYAGAAPTDMWTIPRIMVNRGDSLAVWAKRLETPAPRHKKKKVSTMKKSRA